MNNNIIIRLASANDADLIAELSRQTFYETFAPDNTKQNMDKFMNERFTHGALAAEVTMPGNIFFLAYSGNDAAGYVRMRESKNPPQLKNVKAIEIARIYAAKNAIGKGVGGALMKKCIEIALKKDCEVIWLGVWEKNKRAIDFYERWGFEKFNEHDFVLGSDIQRDWLMKKFL